MFPRGNSMDSEILTWLLIAACAAGFGGGAAWQAMRRRAPARRAAGGRQPHLAGALRTGARALPADHPAALC